MVQNMLRQACRVAKGSKIARQNLTDYDLRFKGFQRIKRSAKSDIFETQGDKHHFTLPEHIGVRFISCFLLYTKAAIASSVSFHPFGQPSPVGVVY